MLIEEYEFGRITIDGRSYTSDVIVSPDDVSDSWWREKGHEISEDDLEPVLARNPDVLVIGTGANGAVSVLPAARTLMDERCEQVEILPTHQAVDRYNELRQQKEGRVVAALHLTC